MYVYIYIIHTHTMANTKASRICSGSSVCVTSLSSEMGSS